jgi:hypothetical protein
VRWGWSLQLDSVALNVAVTDESHMPSASSVVRLILTSDVAGYLKVASSVELAARHCPCHTWRYSVSGLDP